MNINNIVRFILCNLFLVMVVIARFIPIWEGSVIDSVLVGGLLYLSMRAYSLPMNSRLILKTFLFLSKVIFLEFLLIVGLALTASYIFTLSPETNTIESNDTIEVTDADGNTRNLPRVKNTYQVVGDFLLGEKLSEAISNTNTKTGTNQDDSPIDTSPGEETEWDRLCTTCFPYEDCSEECKTNEVDRVILSSRVWNERLSSNPELYSLYFSDSSVCCDGTSLKESNAEFFHGTMYYLCDNGRVSKCAKYHGNMHIMDDEDYTRSVLDMVEYGVISPSV